MAGALDPKPFLGKVISITGAGSGISQATALMLHARGATVAICDINDKTLAETERLLKAQSADEGQQILATVVDATKESAVSSWIEEIVSKFGRLDHAANICGAPHQFVPLKELTTKDFDFVVDVNLRATFNCMQAQVKHLSRGSSIVNFSSGLGLRPEPGLSLYAAAKGGVQSLTSAGAKEYGPNGIRVNAIAPGVTMTPALFSIVPESFPESISSATPLRRIADPDDIAKAVAFLLSDEASYVSGVVLRVDGGYLGTGY
jgi:NAD(P)-dependent dehydrogenase (short-subunit alcohol dehydrogenase family)